MNSRDKLLVMQYGAIAIGIMKIPAFYSIYIKVWSIKPLRGFLDT